MPRYFFHLEGARYSEQDEEGTVYADPATARAQAVTTAGEMLRDAEGKFWSQPEWRMHVVDEQDATVCVLTIHGTTDSR